MRIVIAGITGFVGGHTAEALLAEGPHELHGLSRTGQWPPGLSHLADRVRLHATDYSPQSLKGLIGAIRPESVWHFAGYANPSRSKLEPEVVRAANVGVTRDLFEAIVASGCRPRVLFTSTGLVYGSVEGSELVCSETTPFHPRTPYAESKIEAEQVCVEIAAEGLEVIRVRSFNQIGPRQSADYAAASFARQIARIESGQQPPVLRTGDLCSQRDLTDIRDLVRAYISLMDRGAPGEAYNAGSGSTRSIRELLQGMVAHSTVGIAVEENSDPLHRADTSVSRADIRKLQAATQWSPQIAFSQTLLDILNGWRAAVRGG